MAGDFELTDAELREVARYAAESAEGVLPQFEHVAPGAIVRAWPLMRRGNPSSARRARDSNACPPWTPIVRRVPLPPRLHVMRRYPVAPAGKSRVAQLMSVLDTPLRVRGCRP